jgi:hypothetical protein
MKNRRTRLPATGLQIPGARRRPAAGIPRHRRPILPGEPAMPVPAAVPAELSASVRATLKFPWPFGHAAPA